MKSLSQYIFEEQTKEVTVKIISNEDINDNQDFFKKFGESFDALYKEDPSKMYYVLYKKSVTNLYNKIKDLMGESFYTIKKFNVDNYFSFSKFLRANKDILIMNYQLNNISFDIKDAEKTQDNSEDNTNDSKENENSKYEEYDVIIYFRDNPTKLNSTLEYHLKYLRDDIEDKAKNEQILKHFWKEQTGLNIGQCNIIRKENYLNKYKEENINKIIKKGKTF